MTETHAEPYGKTVAFEERTVESVVGEGWAVEAAPMRGNEPLRAVLVTVRRALNNRVLRGRGYGPTVGAAVAAAVADASGGQ